MTLQALLQTAEDQRDLHWENQLVKAFTEAKVKVLLEEPQKGPDGWPYLIVESTTTEEGEPAQKILAWLQDKGVGCVLNPQKEYPDYVFTWGMIWSFRETGWFFKPLRAQGSHNTRQIESSGPPTSEYLPDYVRQILREFLQQQNIFRPKILVVAFANGDSELLFSQQSLGNPPVQEHEGILEALSWFLPPHYQIAMADEMQLSSASFVEL